MPSAVKPPQTLYDKVFEDHIVDEKEDGTILLYIGVFAVAAAPDYPTDSCADRHLVHEVTSPVRKFGKEHRARVGAHTTHSKHSRASATQAGRCGDRTARSPR